MLSSFAISEQLPDHLLNAQNKELARQIELLQRENDRVGSETEEHKNRLKFMVEHLSNVKSEILSTQQLQDAKRREVESQEHMAQLVERERGRLRQRVDQLGGRRDEEKSMADQVQGRILQSNVRMDELKAAMNFNQEELEQWDVARRQKEDDNEALSRYQRADESKVGGLRPQVSKLQAAIQARRDDLEEEITSTRAAQIELDKTAQDFKTLHDERHGLLGQWEEAVAAMHRRDAAIKMAADRYAEGKEWLGKRQQQLKAREEFLQAEQSNTREMNSRIEQEERAMEKMREDFLTLQKHNSDLQDELETMRTQLQKAVKDRNYATTQREHHEELLETGHRNFELVEAKHRDLIAKVDDEILSAQDLNKQNKLVLDLLAETERSAKELDKEMNRIKDEQYRRGQELFEVRQKQADYLAEISGAQAQGRNTAAKIAQLDQQAFKQQELLYSIDFNVQQMERRVNRARGERTEEEKNELHEKIEMLQKMMDDLDKQHKLLETQVNRVVDDLRHARHATTRLVQEKQRHGEALLELGLQNDSCALELAKLAKRRETALVDGDVQRLQVEGLKRLVRQRDGELMSLENRREQLSLTVVEREKEVAVHHEVLQKEGRVAEDERQHIFTELRERAAQVKALKNRYEVLIGRMDKEVAETTHAQHIVRTAKEREELQVQGDGLDGGIKKSERDLRKLDKTIAMLKGANAQFKHQFSRVGADDEEVLQQKLMKAKAKELQTIVNHRAQEAREVMRSQLDVHAQMQERLDEKAGIEAQVQQAREAAATMMREADEQQELVARYQAAVEKAARLTDGDVAADVALLEEHEALDSDVSAVVRAAGSRGADMRALVAAVLARHGLVTAAA